MKHLPSVVAAAVKPATKSKINWTQWIAAAVSLTTYFGFELTAEQVGAIILVTQLIGNFATYVMKTWFTTTVTPSSAVKM